MTKLLTLTAFILFSINAFAGESALVRCDIANLSDAKECMDSEAKAQPEYEEPNNGEATTRTDLLVVLLQKLDRPVAEINRAKRADYAGFMLVHGDEHEIVYYALNKGEDKKPTILYRLNIADLSYSIEKDEVPRAGLFFLGVDGRQFDVYEDIVQALEDIKAGN